MSQARAFLFHSESYRAAIEEISYGLAHRDPIIVITGALGIGKTTLCRMLVERHEGRTVAATISTPPENFDDLLRRVLEAFGVLTNEASESFRASHDALLKTFQQFLRSLASLNATALVIFDEAHQLLPGVLEEIRLLFNVPVDVDHRPLQIILVGQPELEGLLTRNDLRQLSLRISRRHRLAPLVPGEASVYVNHRLQVARAEQSRVPLPQFSDSALALIGSLSQGIPSHHQRALRPFNRERIESSDLLDRRCHRGRRRATPNLPVAGPIPRRVERSTRLWLRLQRSSSVPRCYGRSATSPDLDGLDSSTRCRSLIDLRRRKCQRRSPQET